MITTDTSSTAIIDRYYEVLADDTINSKIRQQVLDVANLVADDILKGYKLEKMIRRRISGIDKKGSVVTIALQFRKKHASN